MGTQQWRNFLADVVKNDVNILFTGVGRRVELIRAFKNAYADLGISGKIIATDIDPLAPAFQVVDVPYIVPRLTSPDYIPSIIEVCKRESVSAIFPLIDPEIPVLAQHRTEIESTGTRLAVVPAKSAQIAGDKWLTYQFFKELEVPTPHSILPAQVDESTVEFPLFIKPRFGSAAKYTFRVESQEQLRFFSDYVPDPIIQQCLGGPEITNDVICDLDGHVLAVVSRERIEVRWGEVAKGKIVYDPTITDICVRIAHALPAIGPITVQCMMHEGRAYFTEINARFGGGIPLGIAAGVDSPKMLLAQLAGIQLEIPPLGHYQQGLYLSRFDESFFISSESYDQMASHRI